MKCISLFACFQCIPGTTGFCPGFLGPESPGDSLVLSHAHVGARSRTFVVLSCLSTQVIVYETPMETQIFCINFPFLLCSVYIPSVTLCSFSVVVELVPLLSLGLFNFSLEISVFLSQNHKIPLNSQNLDP